MDVAVWSFVDVGRGGLPTERVPVAGEDALCASGLEGDAKAADAAEKVYKAKFLGAGRPVDALRRLIFAKDDLTGAAAFHRISAASFGFFLGRRVSTG